MVKKSLERLCIFLNDLANIILLSLVINIAATLIATVIGTILGYSLYFSKLKHKNIIILINKTLMGLPPVVLGLILFILFKGDGALGFMKLLYTPSILLIAQVLLIIPIATGNIYQMLNLTGHKLFFTLKMFDVSGYKLIKYSLSEYKNQILFITTIGFSRAISEVGAVIIVGGNIAGSTRMMTTSIAMLKSSGDFDTAITLGIILLCISFSIQIIFEKLRGRVLYDNF